MVLALKKRNLNQWNIVDSPLKNPSIYDQLNYDKGSRNVQWGKNSLLINGAGKTGQLHAKE